MSDCRLSACVRKTSECPVCKEMRKVHGLIWIEAWLEAEGRTPGTYRKARFSSAARFCPECGSRIPDANDMRDGLLGDGLCAIRNMLIGMDGKYAADEVCGKKEKF